MPADICWQYTENFLSQVLILQNYNGQLLHTRPIMILTLIFYYIIGKRFGVSDGKVSM